MKLKTIKKRIHDGTQSGALKTVAILLSDKTWSKDHVKLLCEALVIAKKELIGSARRINNGGTWQAPPSGMGGLSFRMHDIMLFEINGLPEWVKFDIIMHDPELGDLISNMSDSLRNTWILIK